MEPQKINYQATLQSFAVPISIVIAGAIIGVSLIFALKGTGGGAAAGNDPTPSVAVNVKDAKLDGVPYVGSDSAKVILVAWEDFQCPFCKKVEGEVIPTLIKNYVNTGKVKIYFKDYEFLGPDSTIAGEWGQSIWALYPTKYLAWRTAWFQQQPQENSLQPADFEAVLVKVTNGVGISASAIKADVAKNKDKYDAILAADQAEGSGFGITGTPGFITGKTRIDGAQPLANFIAALDSQL